jgi:hypothetical protein
MTTGPSTHDNIIPRGAFGRIPWTGKAMLHRQWNPIRTVVSGNEDPTPIKVLADNGGWDPLPDSLSMIKAASEVEIIVSHRNLGLNGLIPGSPSWKGLLWIFGGEPERHGSDQRMWTKANCPIWERTGGETFAERFDVAAYSYIMFQIYEVSIGEVELLVRPT